MRRAFSSRRDELRAPAPRLFDPAQKAKWRAALQAATQQMRQVRYSTDHSMFPALNLDGIPLTEREHFKLEHVEVRNLEQLETIIELIF